VAVSTKWTIIVSVLWVALVMVSCIGIIIYKVETRAWPSYQAEERAAAMGQPAALLACLALLPLWVYWGVKQRQRRELGGGGGRRGR
jgi:hypothetical protein